MKRRRPRIHQSKRTKRKAARRREFWFQLLKLPHLPTQIVGALCIIQTERSERHWLAPIRLAPLPDEEPGDFEVLDVDLSRATP